MENEKSNGTVTPKVSIIIPVFRVEEFINKCIQSLQSQTLKELEFIFVDDCGDDNSILIVESAAKNDSRIKIIYNERNMGAGKSRNRGIDMARGEYIAFVDPDDWIDNNFYEVLYSRAITGKYDIVKANRIKVIQDGKGAIRYRKSQVNTKIIEGMSNGDPLYVHFTSEHQTAIYARSMIRNHNIYNGSTSHSENSVFLLKASHFSRRFCLESNIAYYYYQRDTSSVHVFNESRFSDEIVSFNEQLEFLESEVRHDEYYCNFIKNKISFLLRRYDELQKIVELKYYCKEFVIGLCDALDHVKDKTLLYKIGIKAHMLLKKRILLFTIICRYNKEILKFRNLQRRAKNSVKSAWLYQKIKKRILIKNSSPEEFIDQNLLYLQNFRGSIVFSRKFFELNSKFANAYVNGFRYNSNKYNCIFPPDSQLYKEHLDYMESGELCWRYTKRFGRVSKSTIYLDSDNCMCIKGEILGDSDVIETEHFIIHPQVERKIIDGITLRDYIVRLKSFRKIMDELRQYLDFIFEKFSSGKQNELTGIAYDAFPYNCILMDGHIYQLFDLEFEYKSDIDIGYMIYKVVKTIPRKYQMPAYYELCEHYHVTADWEYWNTFNFRIWLDTISEDKYLLTPPNDLIFKKYYLV